MDKLANKWLEIENSQKGAEVCSIKGLRTGNEYIWKGDGELWEKHCPLLFPVAGHLNNDVAYIDGTQYKMSDFGFVSDVRFERKSIESRVAVYALDSSAKMHQQFPFPFHLEVTYKLRANHLDIVWKVMNTGIIDMPFQIGGLPGINYPPLTGRSRVKGYLSFQRSSPVVSTAVSSSGCLKSRRYDLPLENDLLPVRDEFFSNDFIVIDQGQVKEVDLLDVAKRPYLSMKSQAPVKLLWSPLQRNAPFICMAPLYGLPDYEGYQGGFRERPYTNKLAPGHQTMVGYTLRMDAEVLPASLSIRKNKKAIYS